MLLEIPDNFEMSKEDFDNMTTQLAKMLLIFCTRERYRVVIERTAEKVVVEKEYT